MKMQNAELEFVAFDAQDIIATSGGPKTIEIAGFGNGTTKDATVTFDGKSYSLDSTSSVDTAVSAMNSYFKIEISGTAKIIHQESSDTSFQSLYNTNKGTVDLQKNAVWNGVYAWIADNSRFEIYKQ